MKKIAIVLGFLIVVFIIAFNQYNRQLDILNNKRKTVGIITEEVGVYKARYRIKYSYNVEGKKYYGEVSTSSFECDDGTKYCIGKEFVVYYSSNDPKKSVIDLGKYEKYKRKVEFIDFSDE